ncbi:MULTISPECIES: outer membrane protein assembly factor BamE [Crenobacter]|uniref:Outer membrane protein assembly factor BamE n=2 Tax=Crenobacter TaxID=1654931 RepID=A0A4T0UW39_9NEIS|nr:MULTISPECIES: outer membrane protein assembly factor BamE [Crenobacter]NDV12509.1 outer membrane protein assembly factor BamE [Crenobacter caeni]TIC83067.1 outer membrane protein assembly factor BamE [Crenobacter intestini]
MTKILSLAAALLLTACSSVNPINWFTPHRMVIEQGNELSEAAVAQVKPGMTRNQVRFLLGTPLLADPFHANRWDYSYLREVQGKPTEKGLVTVVFKDDMVVSVEGRGETPAKQ